MAGVKRFGCPPEPKKAIHLTLKPPKSKTDPSMRVAPHQQTGQPKGNKKAKNTV
jgi:hypothetical protein